MGQNYLKSSLALAFQAFLIMVCVGIYAVLIQSIGTGGDISGAIWRGYGLYGVLCFCLFKTGSISTQYSARIDGGGAIGKYSIIYADPPWRYSSKKVKGAAENHYPTMGIDALCALPVSELSDKDCALFLWATFPQLPEALRLIKAWGFRYKTVAFVWPQTQPKKPVVVLRAGLLDTEQRGNLPAGHQRTPQAAIGRRTSIHHIPCGAAQKKPDEARENRSLMGDLPRVELFARQKVPGWDA